MYWLFVYGTLMPGRLRWGYVADDVVEHRPATVAGTLYDTGAGYPALVVDGAGPVPGRLLGLADHRASTVMARLDKVEGPGYRRAPVTATDGTEAVTYEWAGPPGPAFSPLTGHWDREDER